MAALSQSRCLAGSKAFTGVRPRRIAPVSNGSSKFTMKRKDSYMVEVDVGEDEPEDIAVRKFMKKVVDSRVIEQLRARRYKETPLEEFKRRTRERIERIKAKVEYATWEEEYGPEPEVKPFDEFFPVDADPDSFFYDQSFQAMEGGDFNNFNQTGGYIDAGANAVWGGYIDNRNGGYMQNQQQNNFQGGYMYQQQGGGYMQPQQQQQQQQQFVDAVPQQNGGDFQQQQ